MICAAFSANGKAELVVMEWRQNARSTLFLSYHFPQLGKNSLDT